MKENGNSKTKTLSRWILVIFFLVAGVNHFIMPDVYIKLIPPYLPFPELINWISGLAEIVLGLGLIFPSTRKWAALGLILLLIAFIPAHIYIFEIGPQVTESIYIPKWLAWFRLVVIHPLLIYWIWTNRY